MRYGNADRSGVPFRRPRRIRRRSAAEKLSIQPGVASMLPMRVQVEVHGGRHTTASMMRAFRVMQRIEGEGGQARIIEVAPDGSLLVAELDAAQAESLAKLPFVRRIVTMN